MPVSVPDFSRVSRARPKSSSLTLLAAVGGARDEHVGRLRDRGARCRARAPLPAARARARASPSAASARPCRRAMRSSSVSPLQQLHREVQSKPSLAAPGVVHLDDAVVTDVRRRAHLAQEALLGLGVRRQVRSQHFQCDARVRQRVTRHVHVAHRTVRQSALDHVVADGLQGLRAAPTSCASVAPRASSLKRCSDRCESARAPRCRSSFAHCASSALAALCVRYRQARGHAAFVVLAASRRSCPANSDGALAIRHQSTCGSCAARSCRGSGTYTAGVRPTPVEQVRCTCALRGACRSRTCPQPAPHARSARVRACAACSDRSTRSSRRRSTAA